MHAASVHPEPGSNSLKNCISKSKSSLDLISFLRAFALALYYLLELLLNSKEFSESTSLLTFPLSRTQYILLLFNFQWAIRCNLSVDSLFIISLCRRFVKGFSKLFLSFFNLDLSFAFALRSRRQLCYYITSLPLCQYFFSLFRDFSVFIFRRTNFPLFIDYFRSIYYNIYDFVFTGAL